MVKSILSRLGWSIMVLFGLSILIFLIVMVVPGDPARMALGAKASEETVERYREEMHMNDPVVERYYYWISGVFQGDWGKSIYTKREVIQDIKEFAPATVELMFYASIIQVGLGLLLGVLSARYKNRWPDNLIRAASYVGIAMPAFVVAVFLLIIFGYVWPLLPSIGGRLAPGITLSKITGIITLDALLTGNLRAFFSGLSYIILPAFALALGGFMQEAKITRASMINTEDKDYIAMVTSQGVSERVIKSKYLLKPSVIPTVSIIGLDIASLFGNAFLVERIFNFPGLSSYGLTAMLQKDLNAICAVVLFTGLFFVICNILVDIAIYILDPRARRFAR